MKYSKVSGHYRDSDSNWAYLNTFKNNLCIKQIQTWIFLFFCLRNKLYAVFHVFLQKNKKKENKKRKSTGYQLTSPGL